MRFLKYWLFMLLFCVLAFPALAADANLVSTAPVVGGTIDFGPLINVLLPTLGTLITACIGYITWLIQQKMNIQSSSAAGVAIDGALSRAGGIAYAFLVQQAGTLPHTATLRDAAVAQGVNHMMASLPDALKQMGVTESSLNRMVSGELGKLEAADPNVTTGPQLAVIPPATKGPPPPPPTHVDIAAAPEPVAGPTVVVEAHGKN